MITEILTMLISFLVTLILTPKLIIFLERSGIVGIDIQKKNKPKIAEMGGPAVLIGFFAGVFFFIWIKIFLYGEAPDLVKIFAGITTIILITFIGIFDDLSRLLKIKNAKDEFGNVKRIGIKQWQKPLLVLPAAIPLMAIMAGDSTMFLPFFGLIDIGILYPLILIPIGVVGTSNAVNMLAGFNGLEAGLGAVLLGSLGLYAYSINETAAAIIGLSIIAALIAFLKYNWYPAKIMPGDSLVYMIGATVAVIAIIGNMERFALIAFAPWFLELILKLRNFKAENFGVLQKDGTLKAPYKKTYSLTHVVMKLGRFKEYQVTLVLIFCEIILCSFLLYIYLP